MANAEDIVQEVFIHLWEKKESIEVKGSLDNYLFQAVRNKILEFIRDNKTYEKHKKEAIAIKMAEAEIEDISTIYMKLEKINSSLRHLPPKCKNVFVMHKFKGLTYAEIAEIENVSVKTVENHMLKALKLIRKYINK